ncbi:hypothetical protein RQP46_001296 [Phenoliferia psychrophenolica]
MSDHEDECLFYACEHSPVTECGFIGELNIRNAHQSHCRQDFDIQILKAELAVAQAALAKQHGGSPTEDDVKPKDHHCSGVLSPNMKRERDGLSPEMEISRVVKSKQA